MWFFFGATYVAVRAIGDTCSLRAVRAALLPVVVMITVAIIEDNRLVRDGIATMLNALTDISVVCSADGACVDELKRVSPRILLLDVGLPEVDCLSIASNVRRQLSRCDVIVMDLLPVHEEIAQLINAGVAGFILKNATFDEFVQTIRSVASGVAVLPPPMISPLFAQLSCVAVARRPQATDGAFRLTPRESEVIALIALGRSNKEIAVQLDVAAHTAKTHVRNVMEKLELNTRLQIAAYAHEHFA